MKIRRSLLALGGAVLVLTACGADAPETASPASETPGADKTPGGTLSGPQCFAVPAGEADQVVLSVFNLPGRPAPATLFALNEVSFNCLDRIGRAAPAARPRRTVEDLGRLRRTPQ